MKVKFLMLVIPIFLLIGFSTTDEKMQLGIPEVTQSKLEGNIQSQSLIVKVSDSSILNNPEIKDFLEANGLKEILPKKLENIYKLTFDENADIQKIKEELSNSEGIEKVDNIYLLKISRETASEEITTNELTGDIPAINDPYFDEQWGLFDAQIPDTWDIEEGNNNIKIAVIDTGVELNHPDLINRIELERSENLLSVQSLPIDDNGHGTQVAGIILANVDNGE
jgi:subtilisin family serine protease